MWKKLIKKRKERDLPMDGHVDIDALSDEDFLDHVYEKMLGRKPDAAGKAHQLRFLQEGNSRAALILNIIEAPEYVFKIVRDNIHDYVKLLPIKSERPDRYLIQADRSGAEKSWFFQIKDDGDFDWLERKILANGYYESPGVWSFLIDEDKRIMADMIAEFKPRKVLDFGCANGAVLKCLKDKGIDAEGLDISRLAMDKAFPEIREAIHIGDLLSVVLPRRYDVVVGLDIFEHLNPNKLDAYVSRIHDLLEDGGTLFTNIPAFGKDGVFGEIFKIDYPSWDEDVAAGRCFRTIPVDDYGYPKNGHIICADTEWWVGRFQRAGFKREPGIERAFHVGYDSAIEGISRARKSFYVFKK